MRVAPKAGTKKMQLEHVLACQALARARGIFRSLLGPMLLIERSRLLPEPRAFATFMNRKKAG